MKNKSVIASLKGVAIFLLRNRNQRLPMLGIALLSFIFYFLILNSLFTNSVFAQQDCSGPIIESQGLQRYSCTDVVSGENGCERDHSELSLDQDPSCTALSTSGLCQDDTYYTDPTKNGDCIHKFGGYYEPNSNAPVTRDASGCVYRYETAQADLCKNSTTTNTNLGPPPAGLNDLQDLVKRIIGLSVGFAFIALVVVLVTAGIKFLTSGGETKPIQNASQTITWALLGMLFLVIAWLVLQLIAKFTGINVTQFCIGFSKCGA